MRAEHAAAAAGLLLLACGDHGRSRAVPSATASGSSGVVAAPTALVGAAGDDHRIRALLGAELERRSGAILEEDLSHRSAPVRRAAARAAARIADARSATLLVRALTDEDPEVVAWAAHGLGATCAGRERETVRRLVAR
ncbi:MAG TPA: HEAT repeat domain-containing protein, partial [Polyangiaceae bacterium]|nr:HEAT repeat domain-containing protein [Polyangiaceae bacterium]